MALLEAAFDTIKQAITNGEFTVDLLDEEYYIDLNKTDVKGNAACEEGQTRVYVYCGKYKIKVCLSGEMKCEFLGTHTCCEISKGPALPKTPLVKQIQNKKQKIIKKICIKGTFVY